MGGRYLLNESELHDAFMPIGLRITQLFPLGGAASRLCQNITDNRVVYFVSSAFRHSVGRAFPTYRNSRLIAPVNRALNPLAARLDRFLRFWRTGHCIVLEPHSTMGPS
jgi:hypothetical protein